MWNLIIFYPHKSDYRGGKFQPIFLTHNCHWNKNEGIKWHRKWKSGLRILLTSNNAFQVKEKQQYITKRIAFSCNKWLALNLIIFFATKSTGAFATRKKKKSVCASIRITDLFWSMSVLLYRNQWKGHVVKMFKYTNLFPRERRIPFLFKATKLLYRMSKIKTAFNWQFRTD